MIVTAKYKSLLEELDLTTLDKIKVFTGTGAFIKRHRYRDVLKFVATLGGNSLVFFLKRDWKGSKKAGLLSVLKHGAAWSVSRVEWENYLALEHAKLQTAELVAYGEECGLLWERFSFIITRAASGDQTLGQFLRESRVRESRRHVIEALAREIRKMHDAGLAAPDLFTRHIFLDRQGAVPRFSFIDLARLDRKGNISLKRRARDLAALNITAPLRHVSAFERVRFLRTYAGKLDKRLARLVEKRMRHIAARQKFKDFFKVASP